MQDVLMWSDKKEKPAAYICSIPLLSSYSPSRILSKRKKNEMAGDTKENVAGKLFYLFMVR